MFVGTPFIDASFCCEHPQRAPFPSNREVIKQTSVSMLRHSGHGVVMNSVNSCCNGIEIMLFRSLNMNNQLLCGKNASLLISFHLLQIFFRFLLLI